MTEYFKPIKQLAKVRAPAQLKPPLKPKLAQTHDSYWLSYAYRCCPGPNDKNVVDIINLFFQLKLTYTGITLPEAIFWYLCTKNQVQFTYQQDFNGGRAELGGGIPDYWLPDYRIIVLIDGLYWHDNPQAEARDAPLIMAMERGTIDGQPINAVVRISDIQIQSCARDEVFDLALVGISSFP